MPDNSLLIQKHYQLFSDIADRYKCKVENWQDSILLKEQHTFRVCRDIKELCQQQKLDSETTQIAILSALYHDIGRFEQYLRYQTFSDHQSENHALLSISVIRHNNILDDLPAKWQTLILHSIQHHNLAQLPIIADQKKSMHCQLLRDADKLDIWNTVINYYYRDDQKRRNRTIELGLPDNDHISPEIIDSLYSESIVDNRLLKSLNDFKLLQLGWVFDVNFIETFHIIDKRAYLEKIVQTLPQSDIIADAYQHICQYILRQTQREISRDQAN